METILLVDGYNIIGAWPDLRKLKDHDLAAARDKLIEQMAEYQAFTGFRVIVVFDAQFVQGIERKYKNHRIEIIFTKENETADERIEKMAIRLNNIKTQVQVATSDFTEQWVVFGQGALRKSARELYIEMQQIHQDIKKDVSAGVNKKPAARIPLTEEVAEIFEKWRRGNL